MNKQLAIPKLDYKDIFIKRVVISKETGCWEWQGNVNENGYGRMGIGGKNYFTHRVSYDFFIGIKDLYFVIDHTCMNRKCCNPNHPREVDRRINMIENSSSVSAKRSAQTHCKDGHEFNPTNTLYIKRGIYGGDTRLCRICRRKYSNKYYHANKGLK